MSLGEMARSQTKIKDTAKNIETVQKLVQNYETSVGE